MPTSKSISVGTKIGAKAGLAIGLTPIFFVIISTLPGIFTSSLNNLYNLLKIAGIYGISGAICGLALGAVLGAFVPNLGYEDHMKWVAPAAACIPAAAIMSAFNFVASPDASETIAIAILIGVLIAVIWGTMFGSQYAKALEQHRQ